MVLLLAARVNTGIAPFHQALTFTTNFGGFIALFPAFSFNPN
jgi:hypothetical protein